MNSKMIPVFVVSVLLLIYTSGKIIVQLTTVFANNYSIIHVSVAVSLAISVFAFVIVNLYLFYYKRIGLLSNESLNLIYVISITYQLVMAITVLFQIFFIKLIGAEGSQVFGFQNPNDHSMTFIFLQIILFVVALFYLRKTISDKRVSV